MQLFHYSERPLRKLSNTAQEAEPTFKPRGLWLSVKGTDDWEQWCLSENFGLERLRFEYEVILKKDTRILHLSTAVQLDRFTIDFEKIPSFYAGSKHQPQKQFLDWSAVATQWQGIIISPYIWSRRLDNRTRWYYAWDCASGCVWDVSAVEVVELVNIRNTWELKPAEAANG